MSVALDPDFLWRCSACWRGFWLLVKGTTLCPGCYVEGGSPPLSVNAADVYRQEQATRERMVARGGTARHLVRKGLT